MYRYPGGSIRLNPPSTVNFKGLIKKFKELTREEKDEIGYNEVVMVNREPFTKYDTKFVKFDNLFYREEVISSTVDEDSRCEKYSIDARFKRDLLLSESDWTQISDCPLDEDVKLSWAEYRTNLREIPQQDGFPFEISWPEKP